MKVRIKRLSPDAKIPQYGRPGDAGMDLVAISKERVYKDGVTYYEYGTGLSLEIPEGFVGLIFPRSSISDKAMILSNHVGVIDSNYRGEIKFRFRLYYLPFDVQPMYEVGDKVGQLVIIEYPQIEFEEVDSLSETNRGSDGFGSSGK